MKQMKIDAYNYQDLDDKGKVNVKIWLDLIPDEVEIEDENGNIIKRTLSYPSDWEEEKIEDHCEANEYLFSKSGERIHRLNWQSVKIVWGENGDNICNYLFDNKGELEAFLLGVEEMNGWFAYEIVEMEGIRLKQLQHRELKK